jgi:hypothetical protein
MFDQAERQAEQAKRLTVMACNTGRTSKKDRQGRNGIQAGGQADGQKGRESWHSLQAEQARKTGRAEMAFRQVGKQMGKKVDSHGMQCRQNKQERQAGQKWRADASKNSQFVKWMFQNGQWFSAALRLGDAQRREGDGLPALGFQSLQPGNNVIKLFTPLIYEFLH